MEEAILIRRELLKSCRMMIVKAGTRLLTDPLRFSELIAGIAQLRSRGFRVLLVSSGAVGTGMRSLKLAKRPRQLPEVQALASIGQGKLMALYDAECRKYDFQSAQLLLTAADLRNRERYLNLSNCIEALFRHDVLPIINENDSVSISELKFGDNDSLAGLLGAMLGASVTVLLTTESGLRERNADGTLGERISLVRTITPAMLAAASGTDDAQLSIGGMISKLKAASMVTAAGGALWIADGREADVLTRIANAEDVGTLFIPSGRKLQSRKCWIRFFARVSGSLSVDAGAVEALAHGKSLLPSGVTAVEGSFRRGDTVEVRDAAGTVVARGLVNYSAADCRKVLGKHKSELPAILGDAAEDELIHRDNLVPAGATEA